MGLRDEFLKGAKVHSFDDSPPEEWEGAATAIFFPEGGAVITEIYTQGNPANVLENFSNTGAFKAGCIIGDQQGLVFTRIVGTSGQINYVNG